MNTVNREKKFFGKRHLVIAIINGKYVEAILQRITCRSTREVNYYAQANDGHSWHVNSLGDDSVSITFWDDVLCTNITKEFPVIEEEVINNLNNYVREGHNASVIEAMKDFINEYNSEELILNAICSGNEETVMTVIKFSKGIDWCSEIGQDIIDEVSELKEVLAYIDELK